MGAKLTLRMDEELIARAKAYARDRHTSVSQLVARYFALLDRDPQTAGDPSPPETERPLPPRVAELYGCMAGAGLDEGDYLRYLEDKHR